MQKKVKYITQAALIAAMYAVLCYLQNMLFPNSATAAVQFRAAEALCVLAFFIPAAIPGLCIGCFLFNLLFSGSMLLDLVVGPLATFLATGGMYLLRKVRIGGLPLVGLLLPAVFNGLLVGWELDWYMGGGFWFNAGCVALGEVAVLLTLGTALYLALRKGALRQLR